MDLALMKTKLFLYSLLLTLSCALSASEQKPILCIFYTPSHEFFYKEWLLPSIQDDFEIIVGTAPQDCKKGAYYENNWTLTTKKKVEHIVKTIQNNMGRLFIFSDVDIQFFKPIEHDIKELLQDKEFIIQRDSPAGHVCSGFFAFTCSEKTLTLWQTVLAFINKNPHICDQWALFAVLIQYRFPITWDYLPDRYFGAGSLTGRHWNQGDTLPIPNDIAIHHANWCKGIPTKVKQLEYVRNEVKKVSNET